MKKVFAATMIALLVFGCIKEKDLQAGCNDSSDIQRRNVDPVTLPTRLNNEGQIICDLCLYSDIEKQHEIGTALYDSYLEGFWGTDLTQVNYKEISWLDIKGLTKTYCYKKHVTFTYNQANRDMLLFPKMEVFDNSFPINVCSFSVPLFRSIAINQDLCNEDIFMFAKAKVDGKIRVIFKVQDAETKEDIGFYNISDEPTK